MPSSTRSTISNEPVDVNFAYFLAKPIVAWHPLISGVHAWMQSCTVAHASVQKEWFTFIERRLHADAAQMQKLNQATADDAWRLYYEFYEKAFEDYRSEYGQLAALGSTLLSEVMAGTMKPPAPAAAETIQPTSPATETGQSARAA